LSTSPNRVAPLKHWLHAFRADDSTSSAQIESFYGQEDSSAWRQHYCEALEEFSRHFGEEREVVVARCPSQMNVMGMHVDYGGMSSLRMAVQGADTITVAAATADRDRVRIRSVLQVPDQARIDFHPAEWEISQLVPVGVNVGTRDGIMNYAGRLCDAREQATGRAVDNDWQVLPEGQLLFLEGYLRGGPTPLSGFDALAWSNISPAGGMSSSSALVISTAYAALGANGLEPGSDITQRDLIDGVGSSEWLRGTRGGTADHGGMILGRVGSLIKIGVLPASAQGWVSIPTHYRAVAFDSGVPRVSDEARKEESVIAYELGTFMVKHLVLPAVLGRPGWEKLRPDCSGRIELIRDVTAENLGIDTAQLCELIQMIPCEITLAQVRQLCADAGCADRYDAFEHDEITGRFTKITRDYPIFLRRRFVFGLAEQERAHQVFDLLQEADMESVFELVKRSHAGDRDLEVSDSMLEDVARASAESGPDSGSRPLANLPGGYGRLTPEYDRVCVAINEFLLEHGGRDAGAIQRLGAGWGGQVGGLIHEDFVSGR
jgi:galactokinase